MMMSNCGKTFVLTCLRVVKGSRKGHHEEGLLVALGHYQEEVIFKEKPSS